MINNLEPRQFLLTGFALPMPVVIDAKEYGIFCNELRVGAGVIVDEIERRKSMDSLKANVFGDDEIRFD
ncbi:MAG: hypothetical protein A2074_06240 [Candidatus Aquicultor primus]|uniref:Uncharacterized protein n=1 Tax=Candidatus Aquicultor primus TaxID=1797195 RepID=A0A1F2ULY2_9ACTN|nr:MAG: hypothetical protein A2074_06240 [Candidatus Aquicultor primus]